MKKLTSSDKIAGEIKHIGYWINGYQDITPLRVSVFDVMDANGFNSIIGAAKHKNSEGTVLYRGQTNLYNHLIPSAKREESMIAYNESILSNNIKKMMEDKGTSDFFKWKETGVSGWELYMKTTYEAALQHYGGKTNCVDFVDNHWTALWFALNEYKLSE